MILDFDIVWLMPVMNLSTVVTSSKAMILAVMDAILAIAQRSLKNSGIQRGLNPWPRDTGAML